MRIQTHNAHTFLFISHTTNVLLFKFRCNIFIDVGIIKEMPGSVAIRTHCISYTIVPKLGSSLCRVLACYFLGPLFTDWAPGCYVRCGCIGSPAF